MPTKDTIELLQPNDFHHHFRDGDVLPDVVRIASQSFGKIVVMPNTIPPITNVKQAIKYKKRIEKHIPHCNTPVELLMTIYLTDNTSKQDILDAVDSGIIIGAKLYPAGATTNSSHGVTNIENILYVLEIMEEFGLPLLVHSEVTDPDVDIFEREKVFIDRYLVPITESYPDLKIVMEHITTIEAIKFVVNASKNVAATITAHHLLYNRNALFKNGVCPHMYCLPILKRETHRAALLEAATSGSPKFFLGTDSAPHAIDNKESSCGCAGIFTSHAAVELCAEAFDSVNKLDQLENFVSIFGCLFYNLPMSTRKIKLIRESWTVPNTYNYGSSVLKPLRAGEQVLWKNKEYTHDDLKEIKLDKYYKLDNTLKKYAKFPIKSGSKESSCLVISSCFFLIPACYACYSYGLFFYGIVSIITTLISANYWSSADMDTISRYADLVFSKISFTIYCVSGIVFFLKEPYLFVFGVPGLLAIIFFYCYAGQLWDNDNPNWYIYHMYFHLFVAIEQFLVLYGANITNAGEYFCNKCIL